MKAQKSAMAAFTAEDIGRATSPQAEPERETQVSPALLKLAQAMGGLDGRPPTSPVVLAGLVRLAEFAILLGSGLCIAAVGGRAGINPAHAVVTALGAIAACMAFQQMHLNALAVFRAPMQACIRMIAAWAGICLSGFGLLFLVGHAAAYPALWMAAWFAAATAGLVAGRTALAALVMRMTRQRRLERRTVVVGGGASGEELLTMLTKQPDPDLRIFGVFDDRNDARSPNVVTGYPKLGTVSDLVTFARNTRIDLIIFALPITAEERLLQMLRKLWVLPIDIRLAAHRNGLKFRPRSYSYVGDVPVLDVFDKPIADWDIVAKAIFDRVVGALALIVLSPVLLLTALAVKLDSPGPVFFKQKRHGFNNESVEVYKFRSLYADQLDFTAAKSVTKNDPRVTRVGRFIRKTSLDELPQLFNVVLKGNLSLVGPRPHALHAQLQNKAYNDVVDGYFARHKVKPGITGWAQINGWRGETDTPVKIQKRVEHDLAYIENWSILFDLYILLRTPFALTKTENAY